MPMAVSSLRPNINSAGAQLVWMRCCSICQKKSLHLMLSFHSSFYSLHFWKFELSFQLNRLIQEGMFMFVFLYSILLKKFLKFKTGKQTVVVHHDLFWQSKICKHDTYLLKCFLWGCIGYRFNDNPCRERIYKQLKTFFYHNSLTLHNQRAV